MRFKITLKNYRCFEDTKPLIFEIQDGFTALVGVNNSGKSALLKFVMETQDLRNSLMDWSSLQHVVRGGKPVGDPPWERLVSDLNPRSMSFKMEFLDRPTADTQHGRDMDCVDAIECHITPHPQGGAILSGTFFVKGKVIDSSPKSHRFMMGSRVLEEEEEDSSNEDTYRTVDLDFLLKSLKSLSQSLYVGPYRSLRPGVPAALYFDLAVDTLFIGQWNQWINGNSSKKQKLVVDQIQEDIRRIFGFKRLEINASDNKERLLVIIDGRTYESSEVGTGLAQFITIIGNAAFKKPSMIFLDEPELNLHASLQLDFLSTLAKHSNGNIVFATHNLGLARQSGAQIYAMRKDDRGRATLDKYEASAHFSEYLGALSFAHTPGIGFERVLLVEGRTDILTIQQWLKLFGAEHRILLIPMGGQSYFVNHATSDYELAEFKRLGGDVWALIDSEKNSPDDVLDGPRTAFVERCKRLGIECHVLERRATENYLAQEAIQTVKSQKYKALEPYQKLENLKLSWDKSENWLIATHMSLKDLDNDLGRFLPRLAEAPPIGAESGGRQGDVSGADRTVV